VPALNLLGVPPANNTQMGFFKDIRTRWSGYKAVGEIVAARKSAQLITHDDISWQAPPKTFFLNGEASDLSFLWGANSDSYLIELFHTVGEIFTPIDIIARAVADGKPVVKRISSDAVVYSNEYLNKLLGTPNPLQNWQQMVYQMVCYELVTGKSMLYGNVPDPVTVSYRNIATRQNLLVDTVTVDYGANVKLLTATTISDLIRSFNVADGGGTYVKIAPEKVLYTKHNSLVSADMNILGRSPMLAEKKAVEVIAAIYMALGAIYTKGGPRGMWVSNASDAGGNVAWTPPEKDKIIEDVIKRYGFGKTQVPFGVTDQNIRYEKAGADIQDLQPKEMYKMLCGAIFALYNVPRELMPDAEGATYENQKQARKSVFENIAIPRARSFYQSLSSWLKLEEGGLYLDVDFSHINLLQENLKEKADVDWKNNQTFKLQFLNGIITLNDWRIGCKLEKVSNTMYDKLVFDMDDMELAKMESILKLGRGGAADANNSQTQNDNGNGVK